MSTKDLAAMIQPSSSRRTGSPVGLSVCLALLVACGGGAGNKSTVPPPPKIEKSEAASAKTEPKREVSKDTRDDYASALQTFAATDKAHGWNDATCRQAADRFTAVARAHPDLVEAQHMVGLAYQRCAMVDDAERAYQAALKLRPNHGASLSNLGELYYRAGKLTEARQYWESAIKANGKLPAARIGLASFQLDQLRKIGNPKDPAWKKLEEDAKNNLSNALGANADSVAAYTVYGLIYLEGWQANKNRLDLAKLLLDEGKKRDEGFAPLQNAYGLYYMRKNALNDALTAFSAAVKADPRFVEARINVGQLTLGFRRYDTAKEMFSKALELSPQNYDAHIGLGIALRGLKDLDGAEAEYKKAQGLDARRGDAYYNLAVLYKDFRATKAGDLGASVVAYRQARDYFSQFAGTQAEQGDKAEAKEQIAVIDKTVTQIESLMKAQASQPAPAASPAADPAAPKAN
jgi:Flp pilus assembly protein TadD